MMLINSNNGKIERKYILKWQQNYEYSLFLNNTPIKNGFSQINPKLLSRSDLELFSN